ncbi:hypothetical protein [Bacillus coahuilensis]|uniref:hypothetical protein n=1 Tax=Bacillus coahuilensis TaxID=408580 RepID=UPI0001850FAF|nr:hypothetical protein [Bacillus coahuilensis]
MTTIEILKEKDLLSKHKLMIQSTFASVLLAIIVDVAMGKELQVILAILIGGGVGVGIVSIMYWKRFLLHLLPYIAVIIVSCVMWIIMESSLSATSYFLTFFITWIRCTLS